MATTRTAQQIAAELLAAEAEIEAIDRRATEAGDRARDLAGELRERLLSITADAECPGVVTRHQGKAFAWYVEDPSDFQRLRRVEIVEGLARPDPDRLLDACRNALLWVRTHGNRLIVGAIEGQLERAIEDVTGEPA